MPSKTTRLQPSNVNRLRAFARINFGMPTAEFDAEMTPARWAALYRQWEFKEDREDYRTARVCYWIFKVAVGGKATRANIGSFMPDPKRFKSRHGVKKQRFKQVDSKVTLKQLHNVLKSLPKNLRPKL